MYIFFNELLLVCCVFCKLCGFTNVWLLQCYNAAKLRSVWNLGACCVSYIAL